MLLFGKKDSEAAGSGPGVKAPLGAQDYGIDQAVALMRRLPIDENVDLVVRVIHHTLESLNVHLPHILDDASAREVSLQERMDRLEGEIESLAEQIDVRREDIKRLRTQLQETTTVKQRLLLAQKLGEPPEDRPATVSVLPTLPPPAKGPSRNPAEPRAAAAAK
jgi:hypothetical protein